MKMNSSKVAVSLGTICALAAIFSPASIFASATSGTIDLTNKYAWSENVGWVNFGSDEGAVTVADGALAGYAWGENVGWLSLNCANDSSCGTSDYKVSNDGEGNLSGYAYGENVGWVDFDPTGGGVAIGSDGVFSGYAYGENIGWLVFNCSETATCGAVDYKVSTDWRPQSARGTDASSAEGATRRSGRRDVADAPADASGTANVGTAAAGTGSAASVFGALGSFFSKPDKSDDAGTETPIEEAVPKVAPLAFLGRWTLLPRDPINEFVLAPLPREITNLALKFPELGGTLKRLGINTVNDIEKLKTAKIFLPGMSESAGLAAGDGFGMRAIPVAKLSEEAKERLPSDVVFAKTAGELIDFESELYFGDAGKAEQRISVIAGAPLFLSVKPEEAVSSVTGYIALKSGRDLAGAPTFSEIRSMSLASVLASGIFSPAETEPTVAEDVFMLGEFEYSDDDGDGVYTASVSAPLTEGNFEVITVMDYKAPDLGSKELRLSVLIDPEGYVYEEVGGRETRIPDAKVTLLWRNPQTDDVELWPADTFMQSNPQTTDVTGRYSFLVPEGKYRLKVEADGYGIYEGGEFEVSEGRGVHVNVPLKSKNWLRGILDWKVGLLLLVVAMLAFNFYRDKMRAEVLR